MKYFTNIMIAVREQLEGRQTLVRIISNTGWLFADRILRMGLGVVVSVWVARYLGPVQFGLYNYALAFVALFGVLATLGLDGIVVREVVKDPSLQEEILGTAFTLKLMGGFAVLLFTSVSIWAIRPHDRIAQGLVAIMACGTLFQAFDTIDFWFQVRVQSRYAVSAKNIAFILISFAKIGLILIQASLMAFAWAGLAEMALGAVGLVYVYRHCGQKTRMWRWNVHRAKLLLRDSWPLVLSGVAVIIYMRIDQFMLGEYLGNEAVGLYSAATRISEVWYFIPTSIVLSVAPSLVEAKKNGDALYYRRIEQLFRMLTIIALCIILPMTFLSKEIVRFLYGSAYEQAGVVLAIHIWAAIFVFLGVAQGPWMLNEGYMILLLYWTLAGAAANIALNLAMIPKYGLVGAAVATLIAQALASCFMNIFDSRTRRIFYLQVRSFLPMRNF